MSLLSNRDAQLFGLNQTFQNRREQFTQTKELEKKPETIPNKETNSPKTVYCFVGLPGVGKSSQIDRLANIIGAKVNHVGKLAKSIGISNEESVLEQKRSGDLIEYIDEVSGLTLDQIFLENAFENNDQGVILDGFPRSPKQAEFLIQELQKRNYQLKIINLQIPENPVETSMQRQVSRDEKKGNDLDYNRFFGKIQRGLNFDLEALKFLQDVGLDVINIDSSKPKQEVFEQLRGELGLDFESLSFEKDTLKILETASKEIGIEAYVGAGGVYRGFWNGKYGPPQLSTDKDVFVLKREDVLPMLQKLQELSPQTRWSVHSRQKESQNHYGFTPKNLEEGIKSSPYNFRQAGVRIQDGKIDLTIDAQAEADLRNGIIRIDEEVLSKMNPESQEKFLNEFASRIHKTLQEYSGLQLVGLARETYEKVYGPYTTFDVYDDWEKIEQLVQKSETDGNIIWRRLTEKEKIYADEIVDFYRKADKNSIPFSIPPLAKLPSELEELRIIKEKLDLGLEINPGEQKKLSETPKPPEGYNSWFEYVLKEGDDTFNEWVLNQTRSRRPFGGKDPYLEKILSYEPFATYLRISGKNQMHLGQKPTHQGFELKLHTRNTMLNLESDRLHVDLKENLNEQQILDIIKAARLALLWHDMGKIVDCYTPGAHEKIGAVFFKKHAPDWIDNETKELTTWMIENHDLFGRLCRGISEKKDFKLDDEQFDVSANPSYKGALDPQEVRSRILKSGLPLPVATKIIKEIWKADVGSVASLKWILPVADIVEKLILTEE